MSLYVLFIHVTKIKYTYLLLSWIKKALQCVAFSHWSRGFLTNEDFNNIETFPSKQKYLYLSLVERKVAEFQHNIDRRRYLVWSSLFPDNCWCPYSYSILVNNCCMINSPISCWSWFFCCALYTFNIKVFFLKYRKVWPIREKTPNHQGFTISRCPILKFCLTTWCGIFPERGLGAWH